YIERRGHALRIGPSLAAIDPRQARKSLAAQALRDRVLPHRQIADDADAMPVFGNSRNALLDQSGRLCAHRVSQQLDAAADRNSCAAQAFGQCSLAIAGYS